jgi:hypothetical protein
VSKHSVSVTMTFENMESENDVREALDSMILSSGINFYTENYGIPFNKPVTIESYVIKPILPPVKTIDQRGVARLLTGFMSSADRQHGIYSSVGDISGAVYITEGILLPVLSNLGIAKCFNIFHQSGTKHVHVEDIEGRVLHSFVELPDKVMDLADFILTFCKHFNDNEESLSPYLSDEVNYSPDLNIISDRLRRAQTLETVISPNIRQEVE